MRQPRPAAAAVSKSAGCKRTQEGENAVVEKDDDAGDDRKLESL